MAVVFTSEGTSFRTGFRPSVLVEYRSGRVTEEAIEGLSFFHRKKFGPRPLELVNDDKSQVEKFRTSRELFDSILRDKVPAYKEEKEAFLIINAPNVTLKHPIIDVDIDAYVSKVQASRVKSDSRLKPLFAVVTGVGRGKTRLLVELQRKLNVMPNVFCLALTFNSYWIDVLECSSVTDDRRFRYAVNVVARMISMNYHMPFPKASGLLICALKHVDAELVDNPSDLVHECVKYIIQQYRAKGEKIDEFVLLVDESVAIQKVLDPNETQDVHKTLRESLLTVPMVMDDGHPLKVDLVMSG